MEVRDVQILGGYDALSGVIVESYWNKVEAKGGVYTARPAPVHELDDFRGVRVTICATGEFLAIRDVDPVEVSSALAATEFLRGAIKAGKQVNARQVQKAAKAVYGPVIHLRETEETCGCNIYFPDLRPAGMTAFEARTDIE